MTPDGAVVVEAPPDSAVVDIFARLFGSALTLDALVPALLEIGMTALPPFALVHRCDGRARLLVRGSATVSKAAGRGEEQRFDATGMTLWREELLDLPCRLVLSLADRSAQRAPCWVTSGVVPASAIEYTLGPFDRAENADASPPPATRRVESHPGEVDACLAEDTRTMDDHADETAGDRRQTLIRRAAAITADDTSVRPEPTSDDPDHDGHTVIRPRTRRDAPDRVRSPAAVEATRCPSGHPNPPTAAECRLCDATIIDRSVVVIAPPVLGVLRFSDSRVVTLDRPVVIGRAPPGDPIGGWAPAVVEIDDSTLSRFHASVVTDGWQVYVADQGSLNGTSVAAAGQAAVVCPQHERTPIPTGAVVDLGGAITFRYDVA